MALPAGLATRWTDRLLLATLAATLVNCGMIWFLQLNHYPLYAAVGSDALQGYIAAHDRRLLVPVVLPGAAAAVLTILLAVRGLAGTDRLSAVLLCVTVTAILVSTGLIQGPAHLALERGGAPASLIERITTTNWIRTIGWTVNAAVLLRLTARRLAGGAPQEKDG